MHVHLKIKIKSLVQEAKDIRAEERKTNLNSRARKRIARDLAIGQVRVSNGDRAENLDEVQRARLEKKLARSRARVADGRAAARRASLYGHRTKEVRGHARSAFLAYGCLRGVPYSNIETNARHRPDWAEVKRLVEKFSEEGTQANEARIRNFIQASDFPTKG